MFFKDLVGKLIKLFRACFCAALPGVDLLRRDFMRAIAARTAASPRARMSARSSAATFSASGSNVGRIMNSSTVVERRAGFQWTTRKWEGVEGLMEC